MCRPKDWADPIRGWDTKRTLVTHTHRTRASTDPTRRTGTRFLIITHHAITMSRMDRLFGVTMGEKGVSQLVSVDLKKAEAMVA